MKKANWDFVAEVIDIITQTETDAWEEKRGWIAKELRERDSFDDFAELCSWFDEFDFQPYEKVAQEQNSSCLVKEEKVINWSDFAEAIEEMVQGNMPWGEKRDIVIKELDKRGSFGNFGMIRKWFDDFDFDA